MYHIKILSGANIVDVEEDVAAEDLLEMVQQFTEEYLDQYPGYTIEITALN
jgi:hypothetical protein